MAYEIDTKLSQLCERREDLRIQLSLATDAPRPDTRELLSGRAGLILLEAEIVARRRLLGRPQLTSTQAIPAWSVRPGRKARSAAH